MRAKTHLSVACIYHNAIEGNALFGQAQSKLDVFWIGGVVKMDRYGHGCLMCTVRSEWRP